MADVELVIKIPREDYKEIKNKSVLGDLTIPYVFDAIRKGTPLPKGHGYLIDRKDLYELLNEERDDNFVLKVDAIVCRVKPIIEADTESEENNEL